MTKKSMTQKLALTMLNKLAKIFLILSCVLFQSCDWKLPPKVTINQIDTVNNKVNPFKITKYNLEKCVLEIEEQPSSQLFGPDAAKNPDGTLVMHGAFCLTKEDYAKYKAHFQAECKAHNEERKKALQANSLGDSANSAASVYEGVPNGHP